MNESETEKFNQTIPPDRDKSILCRVIPVLMVLSGLIVLLWGVVSPLFRDAEGFFTGEVVVVFSLGIAIIVIGWGVCRPIRTFSLWLALGLVGQAAALQTINAGRLLHFQHYKPISNIALEQPWLIVILLLQTTAVGYGISRKWHSIWKWLFRNFAWWQLLLISIVMVLCGAALSTSIGHYLYELVFAGFLLLINLGNLILCVWALPPKKLFNLYATWGKVLAHFGLKESNEKIPQWISVIVALWVFTLSALLGFFVYQNHPHIPDEVSYLFQARYFAMGLLTIPSPPVPEAFSFYLLPYRAEQWYSIFPPGWPALLAIGVLFRGAWLINPMLAGLNVVLSYRIAREFYSIKTALWVVFLLCVSPWFIFMSMNFMSHTLALTFVLVGLLMMELSRKRRNNWYSLIAGLAAGALSLVRPYDAVIMVIILVIWAIGLDGRKFQLNTIIIFGLGAVLSGSLILPYNRGVTGSAFVFPLESYYRDYFGTDSNALGFGPGRGLGWEIDAFPGHSPVEAVLNSLLNFFSINIEMLGWSIGSLLLATIFIVTGRFLRNDLLMISFIFIMILFYSLYWFHGGPDFGARYWYLSIFPLVVLSVRGMEIVSRKLGDEQGSKLVSEIQVILAVVILSFYSLVNYFPWRAFDKYFHYLNMRPDLRYMVEELNFGKSLIFVQGEQYPDYASAWIYNPLNFDADAPIFVFDSESSKRAELVNTYHDREFWVVRGPSLTGSAYEITAGPITGQDLMEK